jgi:hypothetical protein
VSLHCPMTLGRIRTAGRGIHCTHRACFDLETWVQLSNQDNVWYWSYLSLCLVYICVCTPVCEYIFNPTLDFSPSRQHFRLQAVPSVREAAPDGGGARRPRDAGLAKCGMFFGVWDVCLYVTDVAPTVPLGCASRDRRVGGPSQVWYGRVMGARGGEGAATIQAVGDLELHELCPCFCCTPASGGALVGRRRH